MHHRGEKDIDRGTGLGAGEAACGDTGDLVKIVAEPEGAPDYSRVLSEAALPVVAREHRVRMRARRPVVAFGEEAPHGGLDTEGLEHPPRNVLAVRGFHFIAGTVSQI